MKVMRMRIKREKDLLVWKAQTRMKMLKLNVSYKTTIISLKAQRAHLEALTNTKAPKAQLALAV